MKEIHPAVRDIESGLLDECLVEAKRAIENRIRAKAQEQLALLQPGDVVRIRKDARITPQYLRGATATVLVAPGTGHQVDVQMEENYYIRRFSRAKTTLRFTWIEPVTVAAVAS